MADRQPRSKRQPIKLKDGATPVKNKKSTPVKKKKSTKRPRERQGANQASPNTGLQKDRRSTTAGRARRRGGRCRRTLLPAEDSGSSSSDFAHAMPAPDPSLSLGLDDSQQPEPSLFCYPSLSDEPASSGTEVIPSHPSSLPATSETESDNPGVTGVDHGQDSDSMPIASSFLDILLIPLPDPHQLEIPPTAVPAPILAAVPADQLQQLQLQMIPVAVPATIPVHVVHQPAVPRPTILPATPTTQDTRDGFPRQLQRGQHAQQTQGMYEGKVQQARDLIQQTRQQSSDQSGDRFILDLRSDTTTRVGGQADRDPLRYELMHYGMFPMMLQQDRRRRSLIGRCGNVGPDPGAFEGGIHLSDLFTAWVLLLKGLEVPCSTNETGAITKAFLKAFGFRIADENGDEILPKKSKKSQQHYKHHWPLCPGDDCVGCSMCKSGGPDGCTLALSSSRSLSLSLLALVSLSLSLSLSCLYRLLCPLVSFSVSCACMLIANWVQKRSLRANNSKFTYVMSSLFSVRSVFVADLSWDKYLQPFLTTLEKLGSTDRLCRSDLTKTHDEVCVLYVHVPSEIIHTYKAWMKCTKRVSQVELQQVTGPSTGREASFRLVTKQATLTRVVSGSLSADRRSPASSSADHRSPSGSSVGSDQSPSSTPERRDLFSTLSTAQEEVKETGSPTLSLREVLTAVIRKCVKLGPVVLNVNNGPDSEKIAVLIADAAQSVSDDPSFDRSMIELLFRAKSVELIASIHSVSEPPLFPPILSLCIALFALSHALSLLLSLARSVCVCGYCV
jgi:hypothetical protein